jgi:hypothetical protein
VKGEAPPKDPAQRLYLARLAQQPYKGLYAASARLYAGAFADRPDLAADRSADWRCFAARAAALASAGRGDAGKLGRRDRTRLRRQALDWLRADLTALARDTDRPRVRRTLGSWLDEPDLAGLRDRAALEKLPPEERAGWRKLWADVHALRDRAGR